jgi:PAS domain S-box-containing protein
LFEAAPDGVVICDARAADWPVVYLNGAMEKLTGYEASFIRGRNLRFLQGDDHEQEGLGKIRTALRQGASCQTTLRNYRRDGTMFWNEVTIQPLRDSKGNVTHFAGFHREVGDKLRLVPGGDQSGDKNDPALSTQTMMAYLRDDKLTGLLRRTYFEELVKRDWGLAQRETRRLSFLVFDLDCFATYKDTFGKPGADQSRQRFVRSVRRGPDCGADDGAGSGAGGEAR